MKKIILCNALGADEGHLYNTENTLFVRTVLS